MTGAVLLGIALIAAVLRLAAPSLFVLLASPAWQGTAAVGAAVGQASAVLSNPISLQAALDAANADRENLRAENAALSAKVADLTKLIGGRTEPAPAILAGVLARPPESAYDTLIVDQGTDSGVVNGAEVFGPSGIPVGRVASAVKSSARVALFSAPGTETAAWAGDAHLPVTLVGAGGAAFDAEVPKDASITPGTAIHIAGGGALPLGMVLRVDADAASPTATLRIQSAVNPLSLTWVTIARTTP